MLLCLLLYYTLYKDSHMVICMATVEQIYYPKHIYMAERIYVVLLVPIIVQTVIHHCSKVFTSGQARVNPDHYVIKCVGDQ